MALIRPEAAAALRRWREAIAGAALILAGLWLARLGGAFFLVAGVLAAGLGAALALIAWRRARFRHDADAPGMVEVVEGQIAYYAPSGGGFAALSEIEEVAVTITAAGRPAWAIGQRGAPTLIIPMGAAGAEALFDAFLSLPGARAEPFLAAAHRRPGEGPVTLWQRPPPDGRSSLPMARRR